MKTWIKTSIAAAVIATSSIGATAAMAWGGGGCDGDGPRGMRSGWHQMDPAQMSERMGQRVDTALARLQLALAIRPDQMAAWEQFRTTTLDRTKTAGERIAELRKEGLPQTTPERLQRMEQRSKERLAEMAEMRREVEQFYAKLDEAQKKVFDAEAGKLMGRGGRHGMMGHGGPMGPGRAG